MRRHTSILAATAAIVLFTAGPLRCQIPATGSRIRIVEAGRVIQSGHLMSWTGDTLMVRGDAGAPWTVVLRGERRLEVPTGVVRNHAVKGLAIGVGIGLVAGAVVGLATYQKPPAPECTSQEWFCFDFDFDLGPGASAVAGAGVGMLAGGLVGLIVGAISSTEEWRPVTRPVLRPIVTSSPAGGLRIGASLAF